jgi:hypothetical protein
MRTARLLTIGALGAALILPTAVAAQSPAGASFTATLSLKQYTKSRVVPLTAGKQNVPSGKSVNAWFVSETGSPDPTAGQAGWKNVPTDFKLSDEDGEHTVYVWARATGGVVSDRGLDTTFLDRVAPEVSEIETVPAQAEPPEDPLLDRPTITSRNVSVTFEYSDPGEDADPATGSGVAKYAVVNGTTVPVSSSTAWKTAPTENGPVTVAGHKVTSGNGNKTVSIFVRDRAGNISLVSSVYFKLQLAGPTVTLTMKDYTRINKPAISVKGTAGANTSVAGFFLKVTATDDAPDAPAAGANGWKIKPTVVTLPSTGTWYVWAWAKDDNGSVSALPASDVVTFDNTAPLVTFEFNEFENGSDVDTTLDRNVEFIAFADDLNGSPLTHWALKNGTAVPVSTDWKTAATNLPALWTLTVGSGSKTVTLWVKDAAGNIGSDADEIILTLPAPTMTVNMPAYSRTLKVTGISKTKVDTAGAGIAGYFFSATNSAPTAGQAGWKVSPTDFTFSAGEGNRTLYAWVKDNNGTVSTSPATDVVFIDTVKPSAVISYEDDVLTNSSSDGVGSGITHYAVLRTASGTIPAAPLSSSTLWKTTFSAAVTSITLQSGANQVTVFARDAAGNVSDVDQTAPGVSTIVVTLP